MTSPAFHSASLPGKGVGVVASRLLSPGELLLAEAPLLLVPWWVRGVQYNRNKERSCMLEAQLRLLSTEQRAEFYSLADCKVEEGEEKSIDGIWRTNNFALGPSGPRTDNGLFPRISRFNHSCIPSAEFTWNPEKKKQELRIIKPTVAGSEVTICYFALVTAAKDRAARKEYLQRYYGFPCDCPACSLEGEEGDRDDRQRAEVERLAAGIEHLLYEEGEGGAASEEEELKDIQLAVKMSWERLELMEKTGFKVVSQLRGLTSLLETVEEWQLGDEVERTRDRGRRLAQVLYGEESVQAASWTQRLPAPG